MALDYGVQAVLGLRGESYHLLPLRRQSARFSDFLRRDPDPDQQSFSYLSFAQRKGNMLEGE